MSLNKQTLVELAQQQSTALQDAFPQWRYHEHCTLWGISYFWNGKNKNMDKEPRSAEEFIPELLHQVEKKWGLLEPAYQVSRRRDQTMHNTMYCLANLDSIELIMEDLLQEEYPAVEPLLTDGRLLEEAVERYTQGRKNGELEESIDLVHFLLYYHLPEKKLSLHQYGSFEPLAKRLTLRYGEQQAEERIFTLIPQDLATEAQQLHHYALYGRTLDVDPELENAHRRLVGTSTAREVIIPPRVTRVSLPGRKRVLRHNYALVVDWEDLLKGRQRRVSVTKAFNHEELMQQEIRNRLICKYFPRIKKEPEKVLEELELLCLRVSEAEKKVFEDVLGIFRGMQILEHSDTIAHEMYVPVRKKPSE